jgi:hypothetical protein
MNFLYKNRILASATTFLLSAAMPILSYAADDPETTPGSKGLNYSLNNPLSAPSIEQLFIDIIGLAITLLTPLVVIFIILAGFKYVTARGKPEEIKKATAALTYAIIGGVIIIGAFAISTIIANTIKAF